jgi:hypothetical protein
MKKICYIGLVMVSIIILMVPHMVIAGDKTTITVSAIVKASISKTFIHQSRTLTITNDDVNRGYVDVKAATVLQVRTNSRQGYFMIFEGIDGPFSEVWVVDGTRSTVLSKMGGLVHQPYPGPMGETKELGYKFIISAQIIPGSYPWPMTVNVAIN